MKAMWDLLYIAHDACSKDSSACHFFIQNLYPAYSSQKNLSWLTLKDAIRCLYNKAAVDVEIEDLKLYGKEKGKIMFVVFLFLLRQWKIMLVLFPWYADKGTSIHPSHVSEISWVVIDTGKKTMSRKKEVQVLGKSIFGWKEVSKRRL